MKKYQIVYADPPWPHRSGSRNKVVPYPTMSVSAICNLPVNQFLKRDAILFLWTTDKYLESAIEVMGSWGFKYKTVAFVWVKRTKGGHLSLMVGGWTVKCVELCLLGIRGKPHSLLRRRKGIQQLVEAVVRGHSKKPNRVRRYIELMFGNTPKKIELFAREKHKGWDVWGNEVESDIKL